MTFLVNDSVDLVVIIGIYILYILSATRMSLIIIELVSSGGVYADIQHMGLNTSRNRVCTTLIWVSSTFSCMEIRGQLTQALTLTDSVARLFSAVTVIQQFRGMQYQGIRSCNTVDPVYMHYQLHLCLQ